jgi:hypothetical protein
VIDDKEMNMNGYWYFDEYEDEYVYVPSADELFW